MLKLLTILICVTQLVCAIEIDKNYDFRYIKKRLAKVDTNGNQQFEKEESSKDWAKLKYLDVDKDNIITLDEFQKFKIPYLKNDEHQKLNVIYKTVANRNLVLDLYYPPSQKTNSALPVVVYTHGGGWAAGSKHGAANASFGVVFKALLEQGFAVASIGYRLYSKDGDITIRDCVIDAKDAIRFLAKNSDELNLDSQRFFAMGDSAGGQMAQMLTLSKDSELKGDADLYGKPYNMVAGVSWYGPCDFENSNLFNHDDRDGFRDRFGPRILLPGTPESEHVKLYREMSPINYLSSDSPPLLMIQGDQDTTIPVKHAYYMQKKATELQASVETLIVKNAGHNWRSAPEGSIISPSRQEIIQTTIDFFIKHKNN